MPTPRRKQIRDAALGMTVGRWCDEIEKALDSHVDLGRDLSDEAQSLLRDVLEALAREDLGDKVVFVDTGTFETAPGIAEEEPSEWPTELPRKAREASSDEGKVLPPGEDPNAYSGAIRLPRDIKEPGDKPKLKPELQEMVDELEAMEADKDQGEDDAGDVVADD
jgi:hypothetical protein